MEENMTTKNLVATIVAAVVLLTGCGVANTQADAKSVTSEATQSVILPSTREADLIRASRSQVREPVKKSPERKPVTRTPQKPVKKAVAVSRPSTVVKRTTSWENVRKCIVKRESGGNYSARNPYSSAQGAYQFLDNLWRVPLSQKLNKPGLASVPIYKWTRSDQDRAFWLVWDDGAGKMHWNYPPKQCW
jgi:hypothetical protein